MPAAERDHSGKCRAQELDVKCADREGSLSSQIAMENSGRQAR